MKKWYLLLAAVVVAVILFVAFEARSDAATIGEWQTKIGVDSIAHFGMGAVCSFALHDRLFHKDKGNVFTSKKHRKLKAFLACTAVFAAKEYIVDYKADRKDFQYSEIGILIPLITW